MSFFSVNQMAQLANAFGSADWDSEDVRFLGQSGRKHLLEVRDDLRKKTIISALEIGETEFFIHPNQSEPAVGGDGYSIRKMYAFLKAQGLLSRCIGNAEISAIEARGLEFFKLHFHDKTLLGWRDFEETGLVKTLQVDGEGLFSSDLDPKDSGRDGLYHDDVTLLRK